MDCPKCGGPMWDNRERKTNPKQPDFKCKDREGCDGVIWPKRGALPVNKPAVASGDKQPSNGGAMSHDDYWARKEDFDREKEARWVAQQPRIERMHAQKVAVELIKSRFPNGIPEGFDIDRWLLDITNFFQRDIGRSPERKTEPVVQSEPEQISGDMVISDEPPF